MRRARCPGRAAGSITFSIAAIAEFPRVIVVSSPAIYSEPRRLPPLATVRPPHSFHKVWLSKGHDLKRR